MKRLALAVFALAFPSAYNPGNASVTISALWSSDADAPSRHALTLALGC